MRINTILNICQFKRYQRLFFGFSDVNFQSPYSTSNDKYSKSDVDHEYFFGFEKVTPEEKREKVQSVFTNVASKYDLMNDVMSGGIHRFWKDYMIHILSPMQDMKLLDVAGGTGDIAIRFLQSCHQNCNDQNTEMFPDNIVDDDPTNEPQVVVLDMNDKMLSICRDRVKDAGFSNALTCIQGNAEMLPLPSNYFDAYTIGFGIRNVVHIDKALSEAIRVLKPGGRFLCLEFSHVKNPLFDRLTHWYYHEIIPVIGQVLAGDWKSYQYLVESIEKFPNQETFSQMIKEAGFVMVSHENLLDGIATIHSAYKL